MSGFRYVNSTECEEVVMLYDFKIKKLMKLLCCVVLVFKGNYSIRQVHHIQLQIEKNRARPTQGPSAVADAVTAADTLVWGS